MYTSKHKVFISYHHGLDQAYKDELLCLNERYDLFIDRSVSTGDVADNLSDQSIRQKIRDEYLRDSTVTIFLAGEMTGKRKHVDWEIYSSMIDGVVNKKSGILVINLPNVDGLNYTVTNDDEKRLYPDISDWKLINTVSEYKELYPHLSERILDNLAKPEAKISVTSWASITENIECLRCLIDIAYNNKASSKYDLSRMMRRRDGNHFL